MKPSRKKRKEMKQKANAKIGLKSTESTKKKQKKRKEEICFHFKPPFSVYMRKTPLPYLYPENWILVDKLLKKELFENVQPSYAEPAKSLICQDENGSYLCTVCGTKFSKEQWEQMNKVVEFLNDGGENEKELKALYNGLCFVRYHRTTRGVLVTENVEEEMEMPGRRVSFIPHISG